MSDAILKPRHINCQRLFLHFSVKISQFTDVFMRYMHINEHKTKILNSEHLNKQA